MPQSDFKDNLYTVFLTSGFFWRTGLKTDCTSEECSQCSLQAEQIYSQAMARAFEQPHTSGQVTAHDPPVSTGLQCHGLSSRSYMSSYSTVLATGLWMHPSEP